jgi:hypothetical protein
LGDACDWGSRDHGARCTFWAVSQPIIANQKKLSGLKRMPKKMSEIVTFPFNILTLTCSLTLHSACAPQAASLDDDSDDSNNEPQKRKRKENGARKLAKEEPAKDACLDGDSEDSDDKPAKKVAKQNPTEKIASMNVTRWLDGWMLGRFDAWTFRGFDFSTCCLNLCCTPIFS